MSLQEKLKEIKLQDKCRDFSWINTQKENNRLTLAGENVTIAVFNKLRMFVKAVEEVYSGNWDLDISLNGNIENPVVDILGIIIHYDKLTISNSNGKTHDITDLFVKISIVRDDNEIHISHLSGGRTSITYAEYCSNYFHSHLPQGQRKVFSNNTLPGWGSFCRGSGHINDFMAELNSDGITEERLIPFLVQITGLVSWESLEGGPHKTMRNIKVNSNRGRISTPTNSDSKYLLDKVINYHKDNDNIPDIEFKIESGQYKIVDNDRFEKFLTETVPLHDTDKARVICMADTAGNYYKWGSIPGYELPPDTTRVIKFIFQGREIPFTIGSPPDVGDLSNIEYFLHPNVRSYIKQELEYDSNIKKVREDTIKRYSNPTEHATALPRPGKVAV